MLLLAEGGGAGHPCLLPQKSIVGSVVRGRRRGEVEGRPDCGIDPLGRCRGEEGGDVL